MSIQVNNEGYIYILHVRFGDPSSRNSEIAILREHPKCASLSTAIREIYHNAQQ